MGFNHLPLHKGANEIVNPPLHLASCSIASQPSLLITSHVTHKSPFNHLKPSFALLRVGNSVAIVIVEAEGSLLFKLIEGSHTSRAHPGRRAHMSRRARLDRRARYIMGLVRVVKPVQFIWHVWIVGPSRIVGPNQILEPVRIVGHDQVIRPIRVVELVRVVGQVWVVGPIRVFVLVRVVGPVP